MCYRTRYDRISNEKGYFVSVHICDENMFVLFRLLRVKHGSNEMLAKPTWSWTIGMCDLWFHFHDNDEMCGNY